MSEGFCRETPRDSGPGISPATATSRFHGRGLASGFAWAREESIIPTNVAIPDIAMPTVRRLVECGAGERGRSEGNLYATSSQDAFGTPSPHYRTLLRTVATPIPQR
jgi:hypothetical protein